MIMVTGATGPLGGSVVDFLLKKVRPEEVAVLVRDLNKATNLKAKGVKVHLADYDDPAALQQAFAGIDKLYFVSGSDVVKRGEQHLNVVSAAKAAGVGHVFYTSFQRKNETDSSPIAMVASSHIATERALKASGLTYTILKHTLYADILPMFLGEQVLQTGTVFLPAGDGKIGFATREDLAEAGAHLLTTPGHENKSYELSPREVMNFAQIAETLSRLSGKSIAYVSPTAELFTETLQKAGVPDMYIGISRGFAEAIAQGEFDVPDGQLDFLLGRKATTVEAFLKGAYQL